MKNKRILLTIAAVVLIALAGCAEPQGDSGKDLEESAGQDIDVDWPGQSYAFEVRKTEQNQRQLVQAQPPIEMETSLERENLIRRFQYLNDQNNVHHVYMMSNNGQVVAYETAQGKVSSVNSKLTNDKQIIRIPDCDEHNSGNDCWKAVESPQMDGSYGSNGAAIFFFDTDGNYVEWRGKYLVSEEPMNIQDQVVLVEQVGEDETAPSQNLTVNVETNGSED